MKLILLIIWMLISLLLAISVVGLLLFVPKERYENTENTPSTWCLIGRELLASILSNK